MTPTEHEPDPPERQPERAADPIARLLRRAGPPPDPDPAVRARTEAAARAAWRAAVVRRRQLRQLAAGIAFATAAGLALLLLRPSSEPSGTPAQDPAGSALADGREVATLLAVAGDPVDPTTGRAWPRGSRLPAGARLGTAAGVRATLDLGHGRQLRVDESSRLELVARDRIRLATGAVYVDSPDAARAAPLTVVTPLGSALERGTRFEVRLAPGALSVRVREGRVEVRQRSARAEVDAGERLDVAAEGTLTRSVLAPSDPAWAWTWRTGLTFELESAELERFLDWYRAESGRPARLAARHRELGSVRLHGSIRGLTPDQALAVVARSADLAVRTEAEARILAPRRERSR